MGTVDDQLMLQKYLQSLTGMQQQAPSPMRDGYDPSQQAPPQEQDAPPQLRIVPPSPVVQQKQTATQPAPDFGAPTLDKQNPDAAPSVKDYLMDKYGFSDSSQDDLKSAQADAKQQRYLANMGQAGSTIAAALGGIKNDTTFYDNMRAGSNQGVTDLKEQQANQTQGLQNEMQVQSAADKADLDDPNSDKSKAVQNMVQKLYPGKFTQEDISKIPASMADSIYKPLELNAKMEELKQASQNRTDVMSMNAQDRRERAQGVNDNKDAMALENTLSKGWTARSGQAGTVQGKIVQAESAEALIAQGKTQAGGLDGRQVEEIAQSTARLLGGGSAASARVDALVPHTFWGKAQTAAEWLSNSPKGADMQAFTDRMAETIAREKQVALDQKRQYQIESLPAHDRFRNSNPDLYNRILQSKGIDPSMINDKGQYQRPAQQPGPGSQPKTVTQNGHTYILNDQTGKYE